MATDWAALSDRTVLTPRIDAASISTYVLALIAVGLRIMCRRASKSGLWWDDWLAVLSAVLCTSGFVLLMGFLRPALGHHIFSVDYSTLATFFKAFYAAQLLYVVELVIVKLSILCFYWRLFSISARLPIYTMFGITLVWGITLLFILAFQCNPPSYALTHEDPSKCFDLKALVIGGSIPNIVTDVILMIMPVPYLFKLQIRTIQRILLAGIFMVGGFVAIVSVMRLHVIVIHDLSDLDVTYYTTDVVMWSMVETNVALICCCLPNLKPLLTFIRTGSLYGNSSTGNSRLSANQATSRSKHARGSQRLFSSKSANRFSQNEDEIGIVDMTIGDRDMSRGVGVDQRTWGKSQADVQVRMEDLSKEKPMENNNGISVTKDWTIKYDEDDSSSGSSR